MYCARFSMSASERDRRRSSCCRHRSCARLALKSAELLLDVVVLLPGDARYLVLPDELALVASGTSTSSDFFRPATTLAPSAAKPFGVGFCFEIVGDRQHVRLRERRGDRIHRRVLASPLREVTQLQSRCSARSAPQGPETPRWRELPPGPWHATQVSTLSVIGRGGRRRRCARLRRTRRTKAVQRKDAVKWHEGSLSPRMIRHAQAAARGRRRGVTRIASRRCPTRPCCAASRGVA